MTMSLQEEIESKYKTEQYFFIGETDGEIGETARMDIIFTFFI